MADVKSGEGSLEAPERHPLDWQSSDFHDEESLYTELERVFDICHGCRRCFSLCNAFPTLFDAVDESDSGELDSVPRSVYWDVVDQCYLCDMCFMSKCPYVPPHPWQVDFPHLMLRAKAKRFKDQGAPIRDRVLASPEQVGAIAGIPVVAEAVNAVNRSSVGRSLLEKTLGVDRRAPMPVYHSRTARKRLRNRLGDTDRTGQAAGGTSGRTVLFVTCYGNRNVPEIVEDLVAVLEHNGIPVALASAEACCGMPKLELGDLESVQRSRDANIPSLLPWVQSGWDIVSPIPSCTLMFQQEMPLLFPDDPDVAAVAAAFHDPFDYLHRRHKAGHMNADFQNSIGRVAYQVPCHLRVQNIGLKTRDILLLVPDTSVEVIERCSGHDGTYGVKRQYRDASEKIARPVVRRVNEAKPDHFVSDCPMAGEQIAQSLDGKDLYRHPISLLREAYGI